MFLIQFLFIFNLVFLVNLIKNVDFKKSKSLDDDLDRSFIDLFLSKYDKKYFLTKYPLDTIRENSFTIREENPFKPFKDYNNEIRISTSYAIIKSNTNQTVGLIQLRQISDMWLTEIKGVIEKLKPNSSYFLTILEHLPNNLYDDIKLRFSPYKTFFNQFNSDIESNILNIQKRIGDIGLIKTNEKGIAFINYQSRLISLYSDINSVINKYLTVIFVENDKLLPNVNYYGKINNAIITKIQYEKDLSDRPKTKKILLNAIPQK